MSALEPVPRRSNGVFVSSGMLGRRWSCLRNTIRHARSPSRRAGVCKGPRTLLWASWKEVSGPLRY